MKNAPLLILLFCTLTASAQYTKLYEFASENEFAYPSSVVSDGNYLYGETEYGGVNGKGVVYRTNMDGSGFTILVDFKDQEDPMGSFPYGGLTIDGDTLYGSAKFVAQDLGPISTMFRVNTDGSNFNAFNYVSAYSPFGFPVGTIAVANSKYYAAMYRGRYQSGDILGTTTPFQFNGTNGKFPNGSLVIRGSKAYGTTSEGGVHNKGVLFSVGLDGTDYLKIYDFDSITGSKPLGTISMRGDTIFGTTSEGGAYNKGIIYRIKTDGSAYKKLLDFNGSNGANPFNSVFLIEGVLYGTTKYGGANNAGIVFKINTNGTGYSKILDFNGINGRNPDGTLIYSCQHIIGTTRTGGVSNMGVLFNISKEGTYTKLIDFNKAPEGRFPTSDLVTDGTWLYGNTSEGGSLGMGRLFKIKPDGTAFTKLKDFDGIDGANPYGSPIISDSTLYGTTLFNKSNYLLDKFFMQQNSLDRGAVYKVNINGAGYSIISNLETSNGRRPTGALVKSGNVLYGTTYYGGESWYSWIGPQGGGTIFKVNTNGTQEKLIRELSAWPSIAAWPGSAPVLLDSTLFFTTNGGSGSIVKVNTDTTGGKAIFKFNGTNGKHIYGGLIYDGTFFYGMTKNGGNQDKGVIFKIKPDSTEFTKLYDFDGTNGSEPLGSLYLSGTVLYGLTSKGGTSDKGVAFKINTDGTGFTKLHDFDGTNGGNPYGSLMQLGDKLYGTAYSGGQLKGGVVFSLDPGFMQAMNISVNNITSHEATIKWKRGNGSGSAVFVKKGGSEITLPSENAVYNANATFGSGSKLGTKGWYCVYNGTGEQVNTTNLEISTTYQIAVYEYIVTGKKIHYINNKGTGNPLAFTTLKKTQEIQFETIAKKTVGDPDFEITAMASSGLPVVLSSDNKNVAEIANGKIHIVGAGTCHILASQAGNETYSPAQTVSRELIVEKVSQTITFEPIAPKTYGDSNFDLVASASSGLQVAYESNHPEIATIDNGKLHILNAGVVKVTAKQAGNSNYTLVEKSQEITIAKAMLTATADNKTRKKGESNPAFTVTYSGFVNGDNESVLDQKPVLTSNATPSDNAGEYDITIAGGSDNNYEFTYIKGKLEVTTSTDVNDLKEGGILIYPNPASNYITIEHSLKLPVHVEVYDLLGKKVLDQNLESETLDVSQLNKGMYIIKIGTNLNKLEISK